MSDQDKIAEIVRDVSPSVVIEPDGYGRSLFDLGLDSLDHATILLQVEEKFGIKIPDDATGSMMSVSDIAEFIAKCRSG